MSRPSGLTKCHSARMAFSYLETNWHLPNSYTHSSVGFLVMRGTLYCDGITVTAASAVALPKTPSMLTHRTRQMNRQRIFFIMFTSRL